MKYFIISDIHSNIHALKAVMEYRKHNYPDSELICLGDIVGYGGDPIECINMIFDETNRIVIGNHDSGAAGKTELFYFNSNARTAIEWSIKHLEKNVRNHLGRLPRKIQIEDFLIAHSSFSSTDDWKYITSINHANDEFDSMENSIAFFGHTHIPLYFLKDNGNIKLNHPETFTLSEGSRYLINPGSVGQPRDNDSRASFVIYDSNEKNIEFIRVEYDVKSAQQSILRAGLPDYLAERLERGL